MQPLEQRTATARALLQLPHLKLLGAGGEGVVLTDVHQTFKVFDNWPEKERAARVASLSRWLGRFEGCLHFRPLRGIELIEGVPVLRQAFEASDPWGGRPEEGLVGFLRECLREEVVYHCVNPSNFRLFGGVLCLIDYGNDLQPFTWKDWVFMARRAWLSLQQAERPDLKLLLRASITEWELPELAGFDAFLNKVLVETSTFPRDVAILPAERPAPKKTDSEVTLLIKACYQEGDTLLWMARHLVRQLEGPNRFVARRLVIDPRLNAFPRMYAEASPEATLAAAEQLLKEGTIDRFELAPTDSSTICKIYQRWFSLAGDHPAAVSGVPVSPQLWAFEQISSRYVLQVDADAIVGRRDRAHDYLSEMKQALVQNEDAISVGFQVAHPEGFAVPYDAPKGRYCPEVRIALIDLERLYAMRPLPNELRDGRLGLTWYRSVEKAQAERGLRSLRGGDARSFYIHPPNTHKKDRTSWFDIVDRVEQGYVPSVQFDLVDLTGSTEEWATPSRREEHLFLIVLDAEAQEFLPRLWTSLLAQTRTDWGALIIDPGRDSFAENIASTHKNKITLVRNPTLSPNELVRHALSLYVREPDALLIPLRADDELLGYEALTHLRRRSLTARTVLSAQILEAGKLRNTVIAARWGVIQFGQSSDVISSVLAGLSADEGDSVPGPWLYRRRAVIRCEPGAFCAPVVECPRPAPVGVSISQWKQREGVLFIRHAEKEVGSRFCSLAENQSRGLSAPGIDEAKALGRALVPAVDLILCAPVSRSVQTARLLADFCGNPAVVVEDALLGGRFYDHARWLSLKSELGWSELVSQWISGTLPAGIVEPSERAISALLEAVRSRVEATKAQRTVVITQGYVNTAVFYQLWGRFDFSGGPCYGFWTSMNDLKGKPE